MIVLPLTSITRSMPAVAQVPTQAMRPSLDDDRAALDARVLSSIVSMRAPVRATLPSGHRARQLEA